MYKRGENRRVMGRLDELYKHYGRVGYQMKALDQERQRLENEINKELLDERKGKKLPEGTSGREKGTPRPEASGKPSKT